MGLWPLKPPKNGIFCGLRTPPLKVALHALFNWPLTAACLWGRTPQNLILQAAFDRPVVFEKMTVWAAHV